MSHDFRRLFVWKISCDGGKQMESIFDNFITEEMKNSVPSFLKPYTSRPNRINFLDSSTQIKQVSIMVSENRLGIRNVFFQALR
jgi:hypothetical protein